MAQQCFVCNRTVSLSRQQLTVVEDAQLSGAFGALRMLASGRLRDAGKTVALMPQSCHILAGGLPQPNS
jgi:hypothetical protein